MNARNFGVADIKIFHKLMDGNVYTRKELADKFEVSIRTVSRVIERIRNQGFIIHSFTGGRNYGGIYIDKQHLYYDLKK